MPAVLEPTTVECFEYNHWANQQLMAICMGQSDETLTANIPGSYGSIRDTFAHILKAEGSFLRRVHGACPGPDFKWEDNPGLSQMAACEVMLHKALLDTLQTVPLGQIVQHIISVRVGWFCYTLQDPDEKMNAYGLWGQPDSPERSAAELVRGLDETFAFIESRVQRWTPEDGAATFPDEGEDGQVYEVSRSWVIYHVLEHDLHHGSEVSLILGMNGLPPIEI